MIELLQAFLGGAVGALIYHFLVRDRISMRYRWRCPVEGCFFEGRTNDKAFLEKVKANHVQSHTG